MKNIKPYLATAHHREMNANMHRWKFSALAAAALCAALSTTDAAALVLGPLSVQSHLGSPLRAEIEITQITPSELSSLQARIAAPDVFRAHGMDFSPAARNIQVELQPLSNDRAKLKLRSNTPVTEPFLDLVLDASWGNGSLVRSYTALFDPEPVRQPAPEVTARPQATPTAPTPAKVGRTYRSGGGAAAAPKQRAQASYPAPSAPAQTANGQRMTVRPGDTAGRLVAPYVGAGTSLDQMLVALLRANPSAFIDGNVNRLKAGAVVTMPTAEDAQSTSASEARRIIAAQSRNFNSYRRSLARKAPKAQVASAQRSATGKVQAQVEDASPSAAPVDKLTLSKEGLPNTSTAAEEKLAQAKQTAEQDLRLQELQRNLQELKGLTSQSVNDPAAATSAAGTSTGPESTEAAASPSTGLIPVDAQPAALTPAPEVAENPATTDTPAEPAPEPEKPAPEPVKEPAKKPKVVAPPPAPEPSLLDEILANPLLPAAGGGLLALLLGGLFWRQRKAKQNQAATPTAVPLSNSQLEPDSLFDSSGGQQVDTSHTDHGGGASTMAYSPSQLDASGEVDPIAEADVYLAYGKDEEAEKILKEALRATPERLPLHAKLAEIYAKHHQLPELEATARTVHQISAGQGPDWEQVRTLGQSMDPDNAFYADASDTPDLDAPTSSSFAQALASSTTAAAASTAAAKAAVAEDPPAVNKPAPVSNDSFDSDALLAEALHGDLNFTDHNPAENLPTQIQDTTFADSQQLAADSMDLDLSALDLDLPGETPAAATAPAQEPTPPAASAEEATESLDFSLDDLLAPADTSEAPPAEAATATAPAEPAEDDFGLGALDFDGLLDTNTAAPEPAPSTTVAAFEEDNSLSLDALGSFDTGATATADNAEGGSDDPALEEALVTKLDLAQEFASIGDTEGARSLVEEVMAEAGGSLKARAEKMLKDLG